MQLQAKLARMPLQLWLGRERKTPSATTQSLRYNMLFFAKDSSIDGVHSEAFCIPLSLRMLLIAELLGPTKRRERLPVPRFVTILLSYEA